MTFWADLRGWAQELPELARLELSDDGRTVEMRHVTAAKRHDLKLIAQAAGVNDGHAIEALLYLWLYRGVGKPEVDEGSSRHFHGRRSERIVYRGTTRFEGNQMVGYFYPLQDALLEHCNKQLARVDQQVAMISEPCDLKTAVGQEPRTKVATLSPENAPIDVGDPTTREKPSWPAEQRKGRKTPSQRLTEYKVLNKLRTHDAVAEKLGLERSVYFALKRGSRVSEETYIKAALALGCTVDDLKE